MKRFYIQKLGCPKNDVDADYIAGYLRRHDFEPAATPEEADILIVNSCGFIQEAKEESIEAVLALAKLKKTGKAQKLIMTGCLSQRYASELEQEIPELDGILGIGDFERIPELLNGCQGRAVLSSAAPLVYPEYDFQRAIDPTEHFAYIKIADGCNNRCSYCAIPDIRGSYRSRPPHNIIDEAKMLLASGKKELILVSQEATAYGRDLQGHPSLMELLDRLASLEGDFWIRVMYLHPARLNRELIVSMVDNPKVCNYFDLPLQHISDQLLQSMGRQVTRSQIEAVLDDIRSTGGRSAIRSGFIVGYPGEAEEHFEELCRFVEQQRFDRLGAFIYSAEEGTRAATFPAQVPVSVKEGRRRRLMELQQVIAFEKNAAEIGRVVEVLVERVEASYGFSVGRTRHDAPDIDQTIRLAFTDMPPGTLTTARITGYDGYDLQGGKEAI
jgi:ribosomal protein S12 methylthiotransferase